MIINDSLGIPIVGNMYWLFDGKYKEVKAMLHSDWDTIIIEHDGRLESWHIHKNWIDNSDEIWYHIENMFKEEL